MNDVSTTIHVIGHLIKLIMQIEGAFVQGIGFFMLEENLINSDGLVVSEGTWTYKIPTIDTVPRQFNVEILNSGHHASRVLSSKGSISNLSVFMIRYLFRRLVYQCYGGTGSTYAGAWTHCPLGPT